MRSFSFFITIIFAVVFLFSCKQAKYKPPVEPEKMQQVLTDIHLAEVYSSMLNDTLHQSRNKNFDSLAIFYTDILAHHHITTEQFNESIRWYRSHPADMDSFYHRMSVDLDRVETETANLKK